MSTNKQDHDDQYCLEMFHRALGQYDATAWEFLQERFSGLVRSWVRCHPKREIAYRYESEENYVALSFERFWCATACKQHVQFETLAAALNYLRASVSSTIMDTLRAYARCNVVPLPAADEPGEPWEEDYSDSHEVWDVIRKMLPDKRERRIAYLLYYCGLKPKQIVHLCPQEFNNVREIYDMRRRIVERFARNADSLRWQLQYQGL